MKNAQISNIKFVGRDVAKIYVYSFLGINCYYASCEKCQEQKVFIFILCTLC